MLPYNLSPTPEVLRWLTTAEKLLNDRDFVGSKTWATRVRESDPRIEEAEQIMAIVDTLIAGEKQISNQNLDWYAILQLARRTQDSELIASQYRRLSKMLNPNRNKFAFADHAFKLVGEAWSVLSSPSRKFQFDNEFGNSSNTHFNFLQQHYETPPQHNNTSTHFNFIQEHSEQLHQSAPMQQQFLPQFGQQQLFPPQPLQFMSEEQQNHRQPFPQQLHWSNQTQQSLLTPQPPTQQSLLTPQPQTQQSLLTPQPQQPQSKQPWPQLQAQAQAQHQQSLPLSQPQLQPQAQAQLQQSLPLSQPQLQHSFPWLQPETQSQPPNQPSPFSMPQPETHSQLQNQPSPFSMPQPQAQAQPELQQHLPRYEAQQPSSEPLSQPQLQPEKAPPQSRERVGNVQFNLGENGGNDDNHDNVEEPPSFWTACPYCYYLYEYPGIYADCSLRCQNCKKAIHAVRLAAPPEVAEGDDVYIGCWGFFPIGVSASYFEKHKAANSSWTPFSTMYAFPRGANAVKPKNARNSGPRVYIDDHLDDDQDIFQDISSNEESDEDWHKVSKKKTARSSKRKISTAYIVKQPQVYNGEKIVSDLGESHGGVVAQEGGGVSVPNGAAPSVPNGAAPSEPKDAVLGASNDAVPSAPVDETNQTAAGVTKKVGRPSKKGVSVSPRKQPGRAAKGLGNQI